MTKWHNSENEIDEYLKQWTEAGFGDLTDKLRDLVKPSLEFKLEASQDDRISVGQTKFGGKPDLKDPSLWPKLKDGRFLSFITQINLKEMSSFNLGNELPKDGLVSLFLDLKPYKDLVDEIPTVFYYGEELKEAEHWRVLYEPDLTSIQRADFPEDLSSRGRCGAAIVKPKRILTMPAPDEPCYERLEINLSLEDCRKFDDLCNPLEIGFYSRFWGNTIPFQDHMQLTCQCVVNGVTGEDDPRYDEVKKDLEDWQHLFSIPDDEDLRESCEGMHFIGDGAIYFLIRKQDLAKRDFSKTWLIHQMS